MNQPNSPREILPNQLSIHNHIINQSGSDQPLSSLTLSHSHSQTMAERTSFADNKDTFRAALMGMLSGKPEDTEEYLSKIMAPTFVQTDDETSRDFPAFVAHISWLRGFLPQDSLEMEMTHFLKDGSQRADRHVSAMRLEDGSVKRAETYMFSEVGEDGRLISVLENVRQIE